MKFLPCRCSRIGGLDALPEAAVTQSLVTSPDSNQRAAWVAYRRRRPAHAFMKSSGLKLTISENAESIHRTLPGEARRSADHLLTGQRNEGGNPHPPGPRRTRRVANPNRPSSAHSRPCNRSSSCGTRHIWRIMAPAFRAAAPLIHQRTKLPGRGGEAGPPARWSSPARWLRRGAREYSTKTARTIQGHTAPPRIARLSSDTAGESTGSSVLLGSRGALSSALATLERSV